MKSKQFGSAILLVMATLVLIGIGVAVGWKLPADDAQRAIWAAFFTFVFGVLVGLSEILSHYRDEPVLAATTGAGLSYLLLNGMISLAAFALLRAYPGKVFGGMEKDLFLTAVAAGFGAMTVFRSKLFTFRTDDGKDVSIGPAIVLDTVFRTIDNKIDRHRATDRQERVFNALGKLSNFTAMANYIEASLSSFQNLSPQGKTDITDVINQYKKPEVTWPETLKCMGLGFAFLNIAGEENFDQVVQNLKNFISEIKPDSGKPAPGVLPAVSPGQPVQPPDK